MATPMDLDHPMTVDGTPKTRTPKQRRRMAKPTASDETTETQTITNVAHPSRTTNKAPLLRIPTEVRLTIFGYMSSSDLYTLKSVAPELGDEIVEAMHCEARLSLYTPLWFLYPSVDSVVMRRFHSVRDLTLQLHCRCRYRNGTDCSSHWQRSLADPKDTLTVANRHMRSCSPVYWPVWRSVLEKLLTVNKSLKTITFTLSICSCTHCPSNIPDRDFIKLLSSFPRLKTIACKGEAVLKWWHPLFVDLGFLRVLEGDELRYSFSSTHREGVVVHGEAHWEKHKAGWTDPPQGLDDKWLD